jgi:EmrB/QacA subfamily drug resistance transporter
MGVSMIMVDATIVNVVLPSVVADLGMDATQAEWVIAVYPLVFASLLVTFGSLGDRLGRRRIFVFGAIGFILASVLVAAAPSPEVLLLGRVLQGIGGAAMLPTSLSLVNTMFTGRDRAVAFGVWGATIGGMSALGPLLGGWLATNASWRWAFWINVPIGIVLVIGTLLMVPESKDPNASRGIDIVGVLLSAIGLGAIVFGLIEGQRYGWWRSLSDATIAGVDLPAGGISPAAIALIVGAIVLPAFFWWEARRSAAGEPVLLDLTLFRIPSFAFGNIVALIVQFGEFGLIFVLPVYLVNVLGYSALAAGGVIALVALGVFIAGPWAGQLAAKQGGRLVVRLGMLLEIVGMVSVAVVLAIDTTTWQMAPGLLIYGAGVGFASAQLTNVLLSDVPVEQSGQASGAQSTTRQIGAALGIAFLGTVLFTGIGSMVADAVAATGVSAEQATAIGDTAQASAGTSVPGIEDPVVRSAAEQGITDAAIRAIYSAVFFVMLGLVATLKLPDDLAIRRRKEAAAERLGAAATAD